MIDVYKQIPKVNDNCCPICYSECNTYSPTIVLFYDAAKRNTINKNINLLDCPRCKIRFANKTLFEQYFSKKNNYRPIFFNPVNIKNIYELIEKITSKPILFRQSQESNSASTKISQTTKSNNKTHTNEPFKLQKNYININASVKNIYITSFNKKCIVCSGSVADYVNIIPTSETDYIKISGKYCGNCKMFFYSNLQHIEKILKNNVYAESYTVNTDFHIEPSVMKNNIKIKSAVYFFYLKETETNISKKIIIVLDKAEALEHLGVYHYSDIISRDLLATAWKRREKTVVLNHKTYRIILSKTNNNQIFQNFIINELNISAGGGLHSSSNNTEIVDVLLYSPYTKRYEIIKSSYDKFFDSYYVDMSIFKRFIKQFGNPGIPVKVCGNSKLNGFSNLKEESILHAFGYTVSTNDNLSDLQRQKIIADVLDLGLMSTAEIVNLLEFLISSHNNIKYLSAKTKWERDLKFTSNYKINPERFVVKV